MIASLLLKAEDKPMDDDNLASAAAFIKAVATCYSCNYWALIES